MSLLLVDNFAYLENADRPGLLTQVASTGAIGSGVLSLGGSAEAAIYTFGAAEDVLIINMKVKKVSTSTTDTSFIICRFMDTSTEQCGLAVRLSDNKLFFFRGTPATQIGADSTNAIVVGTEYDLEIKVTIANAGSIELRVNGVAEIGPTSVDTMATSTASATSAQFGVAGGGAGIGSGGFLFYHIIVMNDAGAQMNDFLGVVDVNTHRPIAPGTHADFSREGVDSGANWSQVNDTYPDDSDAYVASPTVSEADSYEFEALGPGVTTVHAVAVIAKMKRDAGGTRTVRLLARSDGVDYESSDVVLGTSWRYDQRIWELDPDGGVAWTPTSFNAAEFGAIVEA